ncbi:hypothetical protein BBO99_00005008 [Phytophthora kernoviae]|uniref:D-isomer specific 2-hydroxyacid dehydrogenase NAD-binding domain-containing protein n=1 Tax=Phytophthora kernoviae TaxID=325452 RepID=A0A3R7HWP1_9STRA|nr:hypothetical protein BBI17_005107 [Phytophthora kernoviae]RLN79805.1 hypothetical protein BBO99_00005008 [Phytophthora kernoviae]
MPPVNAPKWDLTLEQQCIIEQAKVVVMDQHSGGPLFLQPEESLPKDKREILSNIEWVQSTLAGVEQYLNRLPHGNHARSKGELPQFTLTRTGGFQGQTIGKSARTVTVGILGLGDIGQGVGNMLRAAGYKVLGFKRRVTPEMTLDCADRVTPDLDEVLSQSDYLVNVLPNTTSTRYLLNEDNLDLCRGRKPVFTNIGCGDVVSEKTIINALDNGV